MAIILVGLNHKTAPVEIRERLHPAADVLRCDVLAEWVALSTCNRLEIYAVTENTGLAADVIVHALSQETTPDALYPHLYFMEGQEAVSHLMRVACGLDSLVLGEPQILGQVASALDEARNTATTGAVLDRLFTQAVHAGKRARTETDISRHTMSISHAAAVLIEQRLQELTGLRVLVIGAGEIAELAAKALKLRGVTQIDIINRTYSHAGKLADKVGGYAYDWYQLQDALAAADVIVTATSAPHTVLSAAEIRAALETRAGRGVLCVDLAVPRDVDEAARHLPGITYFDIDDLQAVVDGNLSQRQAAIPAVERIILEEAAKYAEWLSSRQIAPLISDLRRRVEFVADLELQQVLQQLDAHDQKIVRQLMRRVVNKILHEPTMRLKQAASDENEAYIQVARELFALNQKD